MNPEELIQALSNPEVLKVLSSALDRNRDPYSRDTYYREDRGYGYPKERPNPRNYRDFNSRVDIGDAELTARGGVVKGLAKKSPYEKQSIKEEKQIVSNRYKHLSNEAINIDSVNITQIENLQDIFKLNATVTSNITFKGDTVELIDDDKRVIELLLGRGQGLLPNEYNISILRQIELIFEKYSTAKGEITADYLIKHSEEIESVDKGLSLASKSVIDLLEESLDTNYLRDGNISIILNISNTLIEKEILNNIVYYISGNIIPKDSGLYKSILSIGSVTHILSSDYLYKLHPQKSGKSIEYKLDPVFSKNAIEI